MALLTISPDSHLTFRGPFNEVVTSTLTLSNLTTEKVCFKVKTTAPRRYCVRPNSGVIEGGDTMEVSIMLQPFQYDPNERNNHKFMVQSMKLDEEKEALPLDEIWKGATPGSVVDKKLKCQFELPTEVATLMPGDESDPAAEAPSAPAAAAPSNTIDQTFITNGPPSVQPSSSAEVQKLSGKIDMLTKENMALKKRVAEASSRAVTTAEQPYNNAAYYIIVCIIGWLIAKFVI